MALFFSSEFYFCFNEIHTLYQGLFAGIVALIGHLAQQKNLMVITKNCKTQQMNYWILLMTQSSLTRRWVEEYLAVLYWIVLDTFIYTVMKWSIIQGVFEVAFSVCLLSFIEIKLKTQFVISIKLEVHISVCNSHGCNIILTHYL